MPFLLEVPGVVGRGVWGVWGRERRVSVARACRDIERESRRAYLWSSSTSKPALPSMRTDDEDPMLNMPMPLLSSSRALETNSKLEAFCSRARRRRGRRGRGERLSAKSRGGRAGERFASARIAPGCRSRGPLAPLGSSLPSSSGPRRSSRHPNLGEAPRAARPFSPPSFASSFVPEWAPSPLLSVGLGKFEGRVHPKRVVELA